MLGEDVIGYIEVETFDRRENGCPGTAGGPTSATCVSPRRTGGAASRPGCSGRPLTGCGWQASTGSSTTPGSKAPTPAAWSYADYRAFLPAVGFRELTRTSEGWTRLTAGGGGRRGDAG